MITAPVFRFDADSHSYFLDDERIPSITQLLDKGGLVTGADYFTEASRDRGTCVHAMCAEVDLGISAKPLLTANPFQGYLAGYVDACQIMKPRWDEIEQAVVSTRYRFAGRPDRVGLVFGRQTVLEIKSAVKAKHHPTQTALQAIALAETHLLPAEHWQRLTLYLKSSGKWCLDEHTDTRDFDVAKDLIKRFC